MLNQWLGTHTLDTDLERAGIPKLNAHGESACLYSLRHAFNQAMQEADIPFRHAQRFMRHSDPKHTANTYLDSDGLDLGGSIDKLPAVGQSSRVARSVVEVVEDRPEVSNGVAVDDLSQQEKTATAVSERQSVSGRDAECPDADDEWSRGESNPRRILLHWIQATIWSLCAQHGAQSKPIQRCPNWSIHGQRCLVNRAS